MSIGSSGPSGNRRIEDPESYVEGSYSVKIPAGTYKIKAMRWDGLYQSEYYTADGVGTTEFSDADSVVIDSDQTDIDFNLNGAPAAQVQVRIVDANTSNAVEFAWFAFFDAEDEYGPVVYPHVLKRMRKLFSKITWWKLQGHGRSRWV